MAEKSAEAGFSNAPTIEAALGSQSLHQTSSLDNNDSPAHTDSSAITAAGASSPSLVKKVWSWPVVAGKKLLPLRPHTEAQYHTTSLEDFPKGYPRVSYFFDSDESFMIYRRFGRLHARLLLHKQDQLREYEDELLRQDKRDSANQARKGALESRKKADILSPPDIGRRRQDILKDIERVLLEYGTLLQQAHTLQEYNKPAHSDHASMTNWFNNQQPLVEADRKFLLHKEDLISIRSDSETAWLDACVESFLRWYPWSIISRCFQNQETKAKTSDPNVHYFSHKRINFAVTFLITILISILLIVPIFLLYWITLHPSIDGGSANVLLIVVLLSFTLLFNCTLSLFTKFKRNEILAASIGYCAVLVVFVGNVGNNFSSPGSGTAN